MAGARQTTEAARARADDALVDSRRRAGVGRGRSVAGPNAVLALQRHAGNAAVSALISAKDKSPDGQSVGQIDAALEEIRRGEPAIDTVEQGLKAAKAAGVPVELEGPKPPASALAVTLTGFGPAQVAPRKPGPPAKRVPPVSPVGKAGAAAPKARESGPGRGPVGAAPPTARTGGAGAGSAPAGPAPVAGERLQPPAPPASIRPDDDPAFAQVKGAVKAVATDKRAHPPASSKAKEAQHAALPPADDLGAQAKASKVETMDAQQPGTFDRRAFIAAVKAAIEAKSPKTLKEAADYKTSGKAGEVQGEVKGLVTQGKEGQAKDIDAATRAPPDQSTAVPKPVAPLVSENPGATVSVPAAGAVPKPAPAEQTNLAAGKHEANQEMAEAGVSDQQLAESNEPEFQQALSDKKSAAAHADSAPGAYRQAEQQVLQQGRAQASEVTTGGVAGMQSSKAAAVAGLAADKEKTKSKDEAKRAQVTARIQGIFAATEADVKKTLDGIDPKVEAEFARGEAAARRTFEAYVAMKMAAYKADRYSGVLGGLRWAKDKLLGMPSKVNEFFAAGRELYLKAMERVVSRVADVVGNALTAAKRRIAKGRADIAAYVKGLPADLKKVGAEASQEIGERFEQLTASVDAKQDSVVDALATKYVEARKGLDERIEALQAENKGLVDKAIGAIKGVINTIRELAAMLRTALARASSVVGEIVKKPVAFLKNLIAGVKGGILRFRDNIVGHLKKGLLSWLFGALAAGGIELPERFDLKGIINLVSSVFGLTWRAIRQRIARRIGEPVMGAVEKGVDIFQKLAAEGVGGLWQMVVEKVGDIKAMLVEKVQDLVITQVITAGIKWLISLLNPAAAFIKACKLIYDVVMFFVNNARRVVHFVTTVIGSVVDIVRGNVSGVVDKVEGALSQMVPILIGFLASVLGLGGLGEKVRDIVMTLQKPVKKAIDWIIGVGLKLAAPVIRGLKGLGGKAKAKLASGKAWAKGKLVGAGKVWAKRKSAGAPSPTSPTGPGGTPGSRAAPEAHIDVQRPAPMNGASHTVYAKTVNGKLIIEMASRRADLETLLEMAEGEAAELERTNSSRRGLRKALKGVWVPLGRARSLHDSTYRGTKMTAALEQQISALLVTAAGLLGDVGREYGLKSLQHLGHASEWVTAEGELKGIYRGQAFRHSVYGAWNSANRTGGSFRDSEFHRLRALIPPGSSQLARPDAYMCPSCGLIRHDVANGVGELTLDHDPSVVSHWGAGGNNSSFDERNDWYNGAGPNGSRLVAMCRSCNARKGSGTGEPKSYKVGGRFRGRGEGRAQ